MKTPDVSKLRKTAIKVSPAVTVPVAVTAGTFQVLTNPFREQRASFKRRYNKSLVYHSLLLADDVQECEACESDRISERVHVKGERKRYTGGDMDFYESDNFCPDHIDRVRKYQRQYNAVHDTH